MIEPELAFADLNDDMACATAYLQYVVGFFFKSSKSAFYLYYNLCYFCLQQA